MTLTQREADLIALANPGVPPPLVAEKIYPWLPPQKYVDRATANRRRLVEVMKKFEGHAFTPSDFCDAVWNTVCNSVRMTGSLEAAFYHAWHLPIQEAYVLEETRPDRAVIAIDFNAMYGACMQEAFPKPSALRRVIYDRRVTAEESLPVGLYRCLLGGEVSDFMKKHNPFRAFYSGRYLGVSLADGLDIDLNEFEVSFYARHFSEVHVVDGIISDVTIKHPLAKEAERSFARRMNYKAQGNKALAGLEKFRMTLLSSCTSRPGTEAHKFMRQTEAMAFMNSAFGIRRSEGEPSKAFAGWMSGRRGVTLRGDANETIVEVPRLDSGTACFSLGQRIVARGRTKLLEMMERIAGIAPEAEICYCNIDSIHFSIPVACAVTVLGELEEEASQAMGSFKIEAVADHGLWLEPGRYWLYSGSVVKFGNQGVSDGSSPFKTDAVHVASRAIGGLSIPIKARVDMANCMSISKDVVWDEGVESWRHEPVGLSGSTAFQEFLAQLDVNRTAVARKLDAFERLKTRMVV